MNLVIPVSKDDHIAGAETAPVTLVEYGDYQCSYCAAAYGIIQMAQAQLGLLLRFVFRNFPLTEMHPQAELAAEAAEAAAAQGKFWKMHDALYENQPILSAELIEALAQELGLDIERFESDLASGRFRERVKRDVTGGIRSKVEGTPTFFINGERYDGNWEDSYWDVSSLVSALRVAAA
jgi:protein-disulfide isomerase